MTWYNKEHQTPFDTTPIEGLYFLDGDALAAQTNISWTKGQKYPQIEFPSGQDYALWESSDPKALAIVHLFGEMDLPLKDDPDRAYEQAASIAEACGYAVYRRGEDAIEVQGQSPLERLLVKYDPETGQMVDVVPVREEQWVPPLHAAHQLMTDEIREQLVDLYGTEPVGSEAKPPVKYFTPDAGWTWYPLEYDGDDLLFGLVVGQEIELGYFSLSELQQVRGPLNLLIERDLHYEPQSVRELVEYHRKLRGE